MDTQDTDLRARIRAARRTLPDAEQRLSAAAAAERVANLAEWARARTVALYVAADGELDPAPIGRAARAGGATTFVPVLTGGVLRFAPFDDGTRWRTNRFGIAEPEGDVRDDVSDDLRDDGAVAADALDLVIVPAVAVDPDGHRLGMGGGWYDRTFGPPGTPGPLLVAVVHDLAVVDALAPEPWDVPMNVVVTPTRTMRPGSVG